MGSVVYKSARFNDVTSLVEDTLNSSYATPGSLSTSLYSNYQSFLSGGNPLSSVPSSTFDDAESDFLRAWLRLLHSIAR